MTTDTTVSITQTLKAVVRMTWPITVALLGQTVLGLIDTMMVGHHSTNELAAAAFVISVCNIPLVCIYGFSSCISILVSQSQGHESLTDGPKPTEPTTPGQILRHALICLILLTLAMIGILEFLRGHLDWFHQPPELMSLAQGFYGKMAWSLLPLSLFMGFRQFSDGLQKTLPPTLITVAGVALNTLLNSVLIFGRFGFTEFGLMGAGYSTLITRWLMFIAIFILITRSKTYAHTRVGLWARAFNFKLIKNALTLGTPSAIQYLFEVGVFALSAIMMGWIGTRQIAAHQIAINLASMTFNVPMSISIATSILVGHAYGRKNWGEIKRITWAAVILAAGFMTCTALAFLFGRHFWPQFFTEDLSVQKIAAEILVVAAFFQVFDGVQTVLVGALRGVSDVRLPTLITFVAYWLLGITFCYLLGFTYHYEHVGIWLGLALSLVVAAGALAFRFRLVTNRHS